MTIRIRRLAAPAGGCGRTAPAAVVASRPARAAAPIRAELSRKRRLDMNASSVEYIAMKTLPFTVCILAALATVPVRSQDASGPIAAAAAALGAGGVRSI